MITINEQKYEIIENSRDAIDTEVLSQKLTEYFDAYDYIVGDWAYGKLRLKGFNDKTNKNYKKINDYNNVQEYLQKYCAYGCKYFVIKRINVEN